MILVVSDLHLGVYTYNTEKEREKEFCNFLETFTDTISELVLLGDIFDFWFEYKNSVPKHGIRLMAYLQKISEKGIKITMFKGNHDMWIGNYLIEECGVEIIDNELIKQYYGKQYFLHHGDGLGPGDKLYKLLKSIFRNNTCQWLFARIHPNTGIGIAQLWSRKSRKLQNPDTYKYKGDETEYLTQFCKEHIKNNSIDYYIFGHRHVPSTVPITNNCTYINTGDWLHNKTYVTITENGAKLHTWQE